MTTIQGPERLPALTDHHRFKYVVLDDDGVREVVVVVSGTVMACDPEALPSPLGEVVRTKGRVLVERALAMGRELPAEFVVGSESVSPLL